MSVLSSIPRRIVRCGAKSWGIFAILTTLVLVVWSIEPAAAQQNQGPATQPSTARPMMPVFQHRPAADRPGAVQPASAQVPVQPAAAPRHPINPPTISTAEKPIPDVVATVDRLMITKSMLAGECLRQHGEEVLESVINKHLIKQACQQHGIAVTQQDVDEEIDRLCNRFGIGRDQWLELLKSERGITPMQYGNDIIWPTIALRRLAGPQAQITEQEVREAYEHTYGPSVRARLIACKTLEKAKAAHAETMANPGDFDKIAMRYSDDASAAFGGTVPPIRRHGQFKEIEDAAFGLADGAISPIISVGGQYIILRREHLIPGQPMDLDGPAGQRLRAKLADARLRQIADQIFRKLQSEVTIQNVLGDTQAQQAHPGVAALLIPKGGSQAYHITIGQLAEVCMQRYGEEVLARMVSRTIIEAEVARRRLTITREDIEKDLAWEASYSLPPGTDGKPDVNGLLEMVQKKSSTSPEAYRYNIVWPRVALKKLVAGTIRIAEEDLKRGFEANYGARVRCLAIVLTNLRRAEEVWVKARDNPSPEYFGDLAEQYSAEGPTRSLRGQIPPISRYSGSGKIEETAFALKPGELSGIIQMGENYIILKCLGHTEPMDVTLDEVRQDLATELFEKKQELAINNYFARIEGDARVENFLTGTIKESTREITAAQPPATRTQ